MEGFRNTKLKGARAEKEMSQKDMASELGITREWYALKENGDKDFKESEMVIILKVLDKRYEEVFLVPGRDVFLDACS